METKYKLGKCHTVYIAIFLSAVIIHYEVN